MLRCVAKTGQLCAVIFGYGFLRRRNYALSQRRFLTPHLDNGGLGISSPLSRASTSAGTLRHQAGAHPYDDYAIVGIHASCGEVVGARFVALPALTNRFRSSRSASVICSPHSHSKEAVAERHTESGPPTTIFSPHSSHTSITLLEVPSTREPPPLLKCRATADFSYISGGLTT